MYISDCLLIKSPVSMFEMRTPSVSSGLVCPETYHGTRMNQRALDFHTQLHEWNEAQRISAQASKHARNLSSARHSEVYLPVKKIASIEHWTHDVNKFYRPNQGRRVKSGSFMRIDVSKYNMKTDKKAPTRSKSAIYPVKASRDTSRLVSAVTLATTGAKRKHFGTDVRTVNNNLIDTQMHYSSQRRNLYSATSTTRPTARLTSAKTCDIESEVDENGLGEPTEKTDFSESETLSVLDKSNSSANVSEFDIDNQLHGPIEQHLMQQKIISRSWSNKMLNVISIDDCKLTCRYRPQKIKETFGVNGQLVECYKPVVKDRTKKKPEIEAVKEAADQADGSVEKLNDDVENGTSNDADDEFETSVGTDIKLEEKINEMVINDTDTDINLDGNNNNPQLTNGHVNDIENVREKVKTSTPENASPKDSQSGTDAEDNDHHDYLNQLTGFTRSSLNGEVKNGKISFNNSDKVIGTSDTNHDLRATMGSRGTSKTSYGRLTNLYSNSSSSKSKPNGRKDKKRSRASKINYAINDMVKDRKVMNSMERDFDTRTAEYGRTVVDKTPGSETFQKLHTQLRRKIDTYIETHSAIKAERFYENRRKNSTIVEV